MRDKIDIASVFTADEINNEINNGTGDLVFGSSRDDKDWTGKIVDLEGIKIIANALKENIPIKKLDLSVTNHVHTSLLCYCNSHEIILGTKVPKLSQNT